MVRGPAGKFCDKAPSGSLLEALKEFNSGLYFECHETLEDLWLEERGAERKFYQGILQVGIGLLHWRRGNFRGSVSLLETGAAHLEAFSPVCRRVDVARLLAETRRFRQALEVLGPERMADLDPALVFRVHLLFRSKRSADP